MTRKTLFKHAKHIKATKKIKKGMALVLSAVLAVGLVQIIPGNIADVNAAEGSEPSVSAYATKAQMMDGTFAPDSGNKGKLTFGKNEDGNTQEWYIFEESGATGASDDNTVIFATKPITKSTFADYYSGTRYYDYSGGEEYSSYLKESDFTYQVYCNYYSLSTVRAKLKSMETDTKYFSTAEQALMNEPKVCTYDNAEPTKPFYQYDKLYLASGYFTSTRYKDVICVGTADASMSVKISDYIESNEQFWLRTPCQRYFPTDPATDQPLGDPSNALVVTGGKSGAVTATAVDAGEYGVQPAAVLNLTDVLFASAARAATSKTASVIITPGSAMTLRLDGSNREIGEVTHDTDTGVISATKSSAATGDVSLVVQGNDGTQDWYYSRKLTGSETVEVTASDIGTAFGNPSAAIDLTKCKIWLETTDADDNMIYAKNALEIKTLNEVDIDFSSLKAGKELPDKITCNTEGVRASIKWTDKAGKDLAEGTIAGYDTTYIRTIIIEPETGYKLADEIELTICGYTYSGEPVEEDGTIKLVKYITTELDELVSITTPDAITVANGTAYENMNLPERVNITTKGGTVTSAAVTWNTDKPISGTYDPAVLTEQVVKLRGTISSDKINTFDVSRDTEITITISAAGITGAPTANVPSGTYTEDQLITLASTTEGAKIYYTLADRVLTVENGTEYTGPIEVSGVAGEYTITQIKAMAVKDGMQASEVVTFTYTIHKPVPVVKYIIKATAGPNGSITPSGDVEVVQGCDQAFNITPDEGYEVDSVIVDGKAEGAYVMYSFDNVKASHTIEATFKKIVSVVEAPTIISQPLNNITVRAGETATFVVSATGMDLTYQWKIDRNDGNGFVDIVGANNAFYTTGVTDKTCNGFKYQCVISNPGGSVTSDTATLTVTDDAQPVVKHIIKATAGPNGNISPSGDVEVVEGSNQTFAFTADEGYEIDTLKVDGETECVAARYTFEDVKASHTIEVTFKKVQTAPIVEAPAISTQPQNVSVKAGEKATFGVTATGTDLTYQWKIDRNDGNGFVDIAGANSASYTTGVTDSDCNGFKYQCVISNTAGSVTTDTVTLTVTTDSNPSPQPPKYEIVDGAGSTWKENTEGNLVIKGNGEASSSRT